MERKYLLISVCFCIALIGAIWFVFPPVFETNDDTYMMFMVSGIATGEPEPYTIFSGFLWGLFLSFLYKINPIVPWYGIVDAAIIIVVMSLILFYILILTKKQKQGFIVGIIIFLGALFFFFSFYICIFQFTAMSAIGGMGAVAALWMKPYFDEKSKGWRLFNNITIIALFLISFNIRKEMGILVFIALALIVILKFNKYKRIGLLLVLSLLVSFGVNTVSESSDEWSSFREYTSQRATYMDYPHKAYEENEAIYESVGWDKSLYDLVAWWFMLDDNFNIDSLKIINASNEDLQLSLGATWPRLIENKMICFQIFIWMLLLIISTTLDKKKLKLWLFFLAFIGISVVFAYLGRLPQRMFEPLLYVYFTPCLLSMIAYEDNKNTICIISVALILVSLVWHGAFDDAIDLQKSEYTIERNNNKRIMEDYAANNRETLFVYDYFLSAEGGPFEVYNGNEPYNCILWGGSFMYSPMYYKQLERNGLQEIDIEDFFSEKISFISIGTPSERLITYINERYPNADTEIKDYVDNLVVYGFKRN